MPTILYAEDDRDCRELFAFVLRQKNYTVYEANNGAQAVQIARDEPIDLIILDVRMPMMTGYDAARILAHEAAHIPDIFLSAKALPREDVAAETQCCRLAVEKSLTDQKRLRQAIGRRLHRIGQGNTPLTSVAKQFFEGGLIFRCGNDQDLADSCHHER